jgi:hypothetical protein
LLPKDEGPLWMPTITHEQFMEMTSLTQLYEIYRANGVEESDKNILLKAQQEWYELATEAAKEVTEPPERFCPVSCERDGVTFQIYGMFHGLIGGDDKEYKDFVSKPIKGFDYVIFENGLNYFYSYKDGTIIPDFMVLGVLGSISLGLNVGVHFPFLMWDMVREVLKLKSNRGAEDGFLYDKRFHKVDPETRRGLEPDPPLPSRLQIDYEMGRWNRSGSLGRMLDPFSIVPRSMFMAGFAVGHAKLRGMTEVPLFVGDLHTMEIVRFLEEEALDHPLFKAGQRFGEKQGISRALTFYFAKIIHLLFAGLAGTAVIGPFILLFLYFML